MARMPISLPPSLRPLTNGIAFLRKGKLVGTGIALMRAAAQASRRYALAMANVIIWQTAQAHQAKLYTQDADLRGLPDVVYQAKLATR